MLSPLFLKEQLCDILSLLHANTSLEIILALQNEIGLFLSTVILQTKGTRVMITAFISC